MHKWSVSLSCLLLVVASASVDAKPKATKTADTSSSVGAAGKTAPPTTQESSRLLERLRGPETDLGKGEVAGLDPSTSRVFYSSKTDDDVAVSRTSLAGAKPAPPAAKSGFQLTMDQIEQAVLSKHQKAKGRLRVSFAVNGKGKATNIMAIGFDSKLDQQLETMIAGQLFPADMRGQRVETTFSFNRGKVSRR